HRPGQGVLVPGGGEELEVGLERGGAEGLDALLGHERGVEVADLLGLTGGVRGGGVRDDVADALLGQVAQHHEGAVAGPVGGDLVLADVGAVDEAGEVVLRPHGGVHGLLERHRSGGLVRRHALTIREVEAPPSRDETRPARPAAHGKIGPCASTSPPTTPGSSSSPPSSSTSPPGGTTSSTMAPTSTTPSTTTRRSASPRARRSSRSRAASASSSGAPATVSRSPRTRFAACARRSCGTRTPPPSPGRTTTPTSSPSARGSTRWTTRSPSSRPSSPSRSPARTATSAASTSSRSTRAADVARR